MLEKLKRFLADDTIFTGTLLCVIAVTAFFLGRYSVAEIAPRTPALMLEATALLPIATTTAVASTTPPPVSLTAETAKYVGSKSGTKYHLMTCAGAKRIKEENKVFFATAAEAEAAGYTPAANCPGL
ncbi:MAG: Ada metal-binding domain-containing protein [Candidatus Paceibacteria bacterium]